MHTNRSVLYTGPHATYSGVHFTQENTMKMCLHFGMCNIPIELQPFQKGRERVFY